MLRSERGEIEQVLVLILLCMIVGGAIVGVLVQPAIDKAESVPETAAQLGIQSLSHSTGTVTVDSTYITVKVTYDLDIENTSGSEHVVYICGPNVEILDSPGTAWKVADKICAGYQTLQPHTHLIRTVQAGTTVTPWAFANYSSYLISNVRLTGTAYVDQVDRHPVPKDG